MVRIFLDSESGEEGFEPPSAEGNSHLQTLSRINQLSTALLDEGLEKRGEAQDGAWRVCEGIDELAAGISYPEYTGEGEVNAVCETLQALVEEVTYFEPYHNRCPDPQATPLPDRNRPHPWKTLLEPEGVKPEYEGVPLRELHSYSREKMSTDRLQSRHPS